MATIDDLAQISGNRGTLATRPMLPAEQLRTYTPEQMARLGAPRSPMQLAAPSSAPQLGAPTGQSGAAYRANFPPQSSALADEVAARAPSVAANAAAETAVGPLARAASLASTAVRGLGVGAMAHAGLSAIDPNDSAGSWIDKNVPGASWIDNQASRIGLGRSYAEQGQAAAPQLGAQRPTIAGVAAGAISPAAAGTLPQTAGASGDWGTAPAPAMADNSDSPTRQDEMQRLQAPDTTARTPNGPLNVPMAAAPVEAPARDDPSQAPPGANEIAYQKAGASGLKNLAPGEMPTFVMGDGREVAKDAMTPDEQAALARWNTQQTQDNQGSMPNPDDPQVVYTGKGPLVDGTPTPSGLLAPGNEAQLKNFLAAAQQGAVNAADPKAAEARAKIAETMGDTNITSSTNPTPGANEQVPATGDDYIKSLPSGRASLVKAIIGGGMAVSPYLVAKNPGLMTQVAQADPSFDVKDINARSKLQSSFKAGPDAENIKSLNTAMAHINHLDAHLTALNNGDFPALNTATNWLGNQLGNKKIQASMAAVETDAKGVAGELAKVFRSSGMSEHEINDWKQSFSTATTPAAQHATIEAAMGLLKGRMDAIGEKYTKGMGTAATPYPILSKDNQAAFDRLSGNASKAATAAPTTAAQPTRKSIGGKNYENDGHGWYEVQ